MSELTRSDVPHSAVIRVQIKVHQQLKDGSLNPRYLSTDELNKLGIAPYANDPYNIKPIAKEEDQPLMQDHDDKMSSSPKILS